MKASKWRDVIEQACKDAGTYQPYFDGPIDTLSDILEKRDYANEKYRKSGGNPVIVHTNRGGADNLTKNPYLLIVDEMNKTALAYWRDLGLTPKGLKTINDKALVEKKKSGLEAALEKLTDG